MPSKRSLLCAVVTLSQLASAHPKGCAASSKTARAIYVLSNDATNKVVAIPIGADGTLSQGTATDTGGAGANGIDGMNMQPAGPDALFSQAALTVADSNVFAVNPKDNTVSMLAIDAKDPTKLTLVNKPAPVSGDFPVTVAASAKNRMVCVGTTGVQAGVSCASFSRNGVGAFDTLRPFDLGQKNPPIGPTNTVSQVFFSEDEMTLYATVKGDGMANSTKKGALAVYPVDGSCGQQGGKKGGSKVAEQGTLSVPAGSAVLFGSQPIPGTGKNGAMGQIFVTDASFGAGIISVDDQTDEGTLTARTPIAGQKATCWTGISTFTNTAFVTDVAANRLVEMSLKDASIVAQYDLSANGDPGLIDLRAGGQFLYALSPGNGTTKAAITVMDLSGGAGKAKMAQHFDLGALGAGKNSQGMAILM